MKPSALLFKSLTLCCVTPLILNSCIMLTGSTYEAGLKHEAYLLPEEEKHSVVTLNGAYYVKGIRSDFDKSYKWAWSDPVYNKNNSSHDSTVYYQIDIGDQAKTLKKKGTLSQVTILNAIDAHDFDIKSAKPVGKLKLDDAEAENGYYVYIQPNSQRDAWGYAAYPLLPVAAVGDVVLSVLAFTAGVGVGVIGTVANGGDYDNDYDYFSSSSYSGSIYIEDGSYGHGRKHKHHDHRGHGGKHDGNSSRPNGGNGDHSHHNQGNRPTPGDRPGNSSSSKPAPTPSTPTPAPAPSPAPSKPNFFESKPKPDYDAMFMKKKN